MIYQAIHFYHISSDISYIWDVLTSIGTLAAALLAYQALNQSNKQLRGEQRPYIVAGNIDFNGNNIQF
jgi:hypothetical protein